MVPDDTTSAHVRIGTREPLCRRVREHIERLLDGETPTLEQVSALLRVKPRTLQYRLRQENSSFRVLLDEVRRDSALAAMNEAADVYRVAQQLGYQDIAAFYRAFRRWTGTNPSSFRTLSTGKKVTA